jgi:spore coat-associated protein N
MPPCPWPWSDADVDKRTGRRTCLMLFAAAGLAVAGMTSGASSLALFSNSVAVSGNALSAGTVTLATDHPSTAIVNFTNMVPGDQVTNPLLVSNTGSLALRYAVSSVADNTDTKGLKDQLVLTIKTGVTTCTTAGFAATGVVQYTGDLDSTAGKLIGDAAPGQSGGVAGTAGADRVLAAAGSETLCFNVSLPIATGNAFQGATTSGTFTFAAEQTANNP